MADPRPGELGRADWLYQRTDPAEDFIAGMHIPCCSVVLDNGRTCHNGPLVGRAIADGDCGEHAVAAVGGTNDPIWPEQDGAE